MTHIEITSVADLPETLRKAIRQRGFEILREGEDDITWGTHFDWKVLVWDGDLWVCSVDLVERNIQIDEKTLKVCGISRVITLPEHRRKGYAHQAMQRANAFMREKLKVAFGLLVTSGDIEKLYAAAGWQRIQAKMCFSQPAGKRYFPDSTVIMVYPCTEKSWPDVQTIDLCGLPW